MNPRETPLDRHPSVRLHNFDKATGFIETTLQAKIKYLPQRDRQINLTANNYALGSSDIWFCSYGAPVSLQFPDGDLIRIQFHYNGLGSTKAGSKDSIVSPEQAVISPSAAQINFGPGFEHLVLRLTQSSLIRKIAGLTGVPASRPLEFDTTFNPQAPRARSLKQTFDFLVRELNVTPLEIPALVLAELEQTLMTSMLCACPNNYSALLEKQALQAAPAQVCLIEEYIEANWDKPLRIEDIATVGGCSTRSIFRAFQQHRGYSPMAFAKQVRLRHAKEMLLKNSESTIAEVALACGFTDFSRFSRAYAHVFGELPSHTLRTRMQF